MLNKVAVITKYYSRSLSIYW